MEEVTRWSLKDMSLKSYDDEKSKYAIMIKILASSSLFWEANVVKKHNLQKNEEKFIFEFVHLALFMIILMVKVKEDVANFLSTGKIIEKG